ncbi:hypothetical protein KY329_04280 [Candidatus Woesearchaeota archaeon]|nr:hypothetical protein [Candidatus Woesearchaeota archaeon]
MKRLIAVFLIFTMLMVPVCAEEEQSALKKAQNIADEIKDLLEKYKNAEIDMVKQEVMTIKDEQGNSKDCDVAIFYKSGKQARFSTENGEFDGNFDHGKSFPGEPLSIRLSGCPCKPISTTHTTDYPKIDELKEKLKDVLEKKLQEIGEEQGKKLVKKAITTLFEHLGYGAAASGFLSGFGIGASLGAPIGQYLTDSINQILDMATEANAQASELMEAAGDTPEPMNPLVGQVHPRGFLGNLFGTDPQIVNTWNVTVQCFMYDFTPKTAEWISIPKIIERTEPRVHPLPPLTPPGQSVEEKERQRREEQERRAREEQERRQKAKEAYEKRMKELEEKAEKIRKECPICDPIREKIAEMNEKIKEQEEKVAGLKNEADNAQEEFDDAKNALDNARQRLDDFDNPKSSMTDSETGRTVTTTDIEVAREAAQENWEAYTRGEQGAQQTMDNWETQDQRMPELKAKARERLQNKIAEAEQKLNEAQQANQAKQHELSREQQLLDSLKRQLEDLNRQLEDCIKKCVEYAMQIAKGQYTGYGELPEVPEEIQKGPECARYEALLRTKGMTPELYEKLDKEEREDSGITLSMQGALQEAKNKCNKEELATAPQYYDYQETRYEYTTRPQEETQPKSCAELCSGRDMSTRRPDWSSQILNELNEKGYCKASASIGYPDYVNIGSCTCYSSQKPSVSVSQDTLVCRNTICGDVPCGGSRKCSCGEKCIATASCEWKGWQQKGDSYQAVAGVVQQ